MSLKQSSKTDGQSSKINLLIAFVTDRTATTKSACTLLIRTPRKCEVVAYTIVDIRLTWYETNSRMKDPVL